MIEEFLYKRIDKDPKLNVWFVFPAIESFALSSIGYLNIFKNLDLMKNVFAERIYADTKTTKIIPKNVDLIGISTSFEIDILAIIKILKKYNIPLNSNERDENCPLVFGGGPVLSANPLPYQEFYDFICVGDSKDTLSSIVKIIIDNKGKNKDETLMELDKLPYVWVPKFKKRKKIIPTRDDIKKPFYTPILSEKSFFKNTFIIEIERGCPKKCNFCLASWLNLPVRFSEYKEIIKALDMALEHTDKIALLGAYVAGHPDFEKILEYLEKKHEEKPISLSLSSLRADLTTKKTVQILSKLGQKSCTIALEAGSERLRKLINKDLKESDILKTVKTIRENGLTSVKIYVMIGHPKETDEDIKEIINIGKKLKDENKGFDITFSLSTFIPKANTPYQLIEREDSKSLDKKIKYLKKELHKTGIKLRTTSVEWDDIQAILSRYPESLYEYFVRVVENGGNLGSFKQIWKKMQKENLLPDFKETIKCPVSKNINEKLPWEFLSDNNSKILKEIYLKTKKNRV